MSREDILNPNQNFKDTWEPIGATAGRVVDRLVPRPIIKVQRVPCATCIYRADSPLGSLTD